MKNLRKFKAFSLLELVVAIVVIGIVSTTFPIILQNIVKSSKNISTEEIFYQEFSLLLLINSAYFDENNTVGDNYYKDLNATNGDSELLLSNLGKNYAGEVNRIGKHQINNNEFRSGSDENNSVSAIGPDTDENDSTKYDDIDDYNGFSESVNSNYGEITLHVNVKYINDEANYSDNDINFTLDPSSNTNKTNIKLITITTQVEDFNITLSYPAMNIGGSKFLSLDEIRR